MKKNWKRDDLIVRSLADSYLPIALVLGFYVILHGNISPGGGFQGGVLAASGVLLLYLGYGFRGVATALNMERLHKLEAVGAIAYVLFAMLGIFCGYNFCRNVLFDQRQYRRPLELRHDRAHELLRRLQGPHRRRLPAAAGYIPARHGARP